MTHSGAEEMHGRRPLDGRVAIVTGGGSGIGASVAMSLAGRGAHVVVAGRREDRLDGVVQGIGSRGGTASSMRTDVTDEKQVDSLLDGIVSRFGRLDYAVNSAGVGTSGRLVDLSASDLDLNLRTNLYGTFFSMRAELRAMDRSGGGSIVNVASIAAIRGLAGLSAYSAGKHAVAGLTRSAALEYAASGIRINAIAPGTTDTELLERLPSAQRESLAAATAMKRLAHAEEIAAGILYLLVDATYSTGLVLTADGGG